MAEWQQLLPTKNYAVCQECGTKRNIRDVQNCPVCEHETEWQKSKRERAVHPKKEEMERLRNSGENGKKMTYREIGEKVGVPYQMVHYILNH